MQLDLASLELLSGFLRGAVFASRVSPDDSPREPRLKMGKSERCGSRECGISVQRLPTGK